MKRILVDVDGVVADLHAEWVRLYNDDYDDTLKVESIDRWAMHEFVKPECGNRVYEYLNSTTLYDNIHPIDGAVSGIQWLRSHGYDVVFVTSGVYPSKILWLDRLGLLLGEKPLSSSDVVVCHNKNLIKGDILIDDRVENCNNFSGLSILFAQPWNSNHQTGHYRADNWPDVIQYLARKYSGAL